MSQSHLITNMREEHRLRELDMRMLRKIFGPEEYKVRGDWRKLHIEELHNLYCSPTINWVIESTKWGKCRSWSTYSAQERCIHGFGGET